MYANITSAGLFGRQACPVQVEADLSLGVPSFEVVGLPDAAVRESRDRVKASLRNSGFEFPLARITVNLAPADLKKVGPIYDLPILLALLAASGQLRLPQGKTLEGDLFMGELALDGSVRRVQGVLPMAIMAREQGFRRLFVPADNAAEASAVQGLEIYGVSSARELIDFLEGLKAIAPQLPLEFHPTSAPHADMSEVLGQKVAKRAMEVAAAGGHNVLMVGSPGSGKSMLARRLPGILPDMTFEEAIETTKIHSIAGTLSPQEPIVTVRPFRAPHHTISAAGLSGCGSIPRPGELSLAHNGVLFLDEVPEFDRQVLEVLRQPMEEAAVTIARVNGTLTYPCQVLLVAAMNPCPCGYFGHPNHKCRCSPQQVARYLGRISGPFLDRIDLHIELAPVKFSQLTKQQKGETSAQIRERVNRARAIQLARYAGTGIRCNAQLTPELLRKYCQVTDEGMAQLKLAFERLDLSARGYDRILKVARTIADLAESPQIQKEHICEAIVYRSLDRKYWGKI